MLEYIRSQPAFLERPRPLDVFATPFEGKINPLTHAAVEPPTVVLEPDVIPEQVQTLTKIGVTVTDVDQLLGWGEFGSRGTEALPPIRCMDEYLDRLRWIAAEILPEAQCRPTTISS